MHVRRLNVQLWVSLVLEVYADRCWIQFSESSAITSYANSLHQLVLHDLPVISVATLVREIPAIEVAVLEKRAGLIGSVEYEFYRQNRAPLELDIFDHVDLAFYFVDRGYFSHVPGGFIPQVALVEILLSVRGEPEDRDIALALILLGLPSASARGEIAVGVEAGHGVGVSLLESFPYCVAIVAKKAVDRFARVVKAGVLRISVAHNVKRNRDPYSGNKSQGGQALSQRYQSSFHRHNPPAPAVWPTQLTTTPLPAFERAGSYSEHPGSRATRAA